MSTKVNPQPPLNQTINSTWVRYRAACYLRGRGLTYGTGDEIVPKQAIDLGKFSISADYLRGPQIDICDTSLSVIAKGSLDHIFVGNRLAEFPDPQSFIKECTERLTEGGHLIIHMIGERSEEILGWVRSCGLWKEKALYLRDGQVLGIWKLKGRQQRGIEPQRPRATKRACIARYGAIGDMIMISPLIRTLKEDGYEVTLNITPYCAEVLRGNPYIDNIVLQERDAIPNQDLGGYWKEWMQDYDRYINLSESIEGKLIKVEGRRDFYTSKAWREETCSANYYDQTLRLGGYPGVQGTKGELYFNRDEQKAATFARKRYVDKFLVIWALKGSSHHKVYPLLEPTLNEWLSTHPDAIVMLAGGPADQALEFQHPQVLSTCGRIPLREVFALTQVADLVVGPESAIINAAGCFSTPKIPLLSHSTHGNLCQYWENDYCLAPEDIPCYPCHQLHYSLASCVVTDILTDKGDLVSTTPVCAAIGISPSRLQSRLSEVYNLWKSSTPSTT